jgi:transposase InsO family protein
MRIGRSTFYDTPDAGARDLTIIAEMKTICDEFEAYGYRRVDAELRHRGIVVNAKEIRRLMREHALNPKQRRRFIATTDSDHDCPIFPNLAKNMKLDGTVHFRLRGDGRSLLLVTLRSSRGNDPPGENRHFLSRLTCGHHSNSFRSVAPPAPGQLKPVTVPVWIAVGSAAGAAARASAATTPCAPLRGGLQS